jgi:hypothetical protein
MTTETSSFDEAITLAKQIADRDDANLRSGAPWAFWSDTAKNLAAALATIEPRAWLFEGVFPLEPGAKSPATTSFVTTDRARADQSAADKSYASVTVTPLYGPGAPAASS